MIHFALTDHAIQRARERAGWNRETLRRMLERIFFDGAAASYLGRRLRMFLQAFQRRDPKLLPAV